MAYGYYNSVDITVKTDTGKKYSFHAEPFDQKSGGTGTISLRKEKLKTLIDTTSINEFSKKLLDCLGMDTELERVLGEIESLSKSTITEEYCLVKGHPDRSKDDAKPKTIEMFGALPLLNKIKVLDGAERLGTVFKNFQAFKTALENDCSSTDLIETVELRELDNAWGYIASERFSNFMGELGFEYEDWEPFEEDEDEEALRALENKLNSLYEKNLFHECSHEAIVDSCMAICDGRDGPFAFCGQRIFALDMKSGEVKKTWDIKSCEA